MDDTLKRIVIEDNNGVSREAHLITYLISDDKEAKYVVYSKGEISGEDGDMVIYISKIVREDNALYVEEITDNQEWSNVLNLLKKIANA